MNTITTIIFDIGGVLYSLDFATKWNGFVKKTTRNLDEIKRVLYHDDLFYPYEKGVLTSNEYYKEVSTRLRSSMSFSDFRDIWNSLLVRREDMFRLAVSLSHILNVCVISNTNDLNAEVLDRDLMPLTSHLVYSFRVGCMKPDSRIYRTALEQWKLQPEECLFFDDQVENVEGARSVGINSMLFTGINEMKSSLADAGVFSDPTSWR
jgi:epoxide hydrolase-like predicted phosphatase